MLFLLIFNKLSVTIQKRYTDYQRVKCDKLLGT
nr:MAG TPA: hypothetical protein [Caudoviricetes sp.]